MDADRIDPPADDNQGEDALTVEQQEALDDDQPHEDEQLPLQFDRPFAPPD